MAKGILKKVHVNQYKIKSNQKLGAREPVMTVKTSKKNHLANDVQILGPCQLVYSPDKPLSCGARVWITTTAPVLVDGVLIE